MADSTDDEVVPGVVLSGDEVVSLESAAGAGPGTRPRNRRTSVELIRFLADVGRLLWRLQRDPRVPWPAKVVAGGALAYVVSPINVIPDHIPGIGRMDDLFVVARAMRYLLSSAGYDVIHELWPGSEDGFALLLLLGGVQR
jgi:uncharacterized membrane protein YkvA (DUF1232 family)